MVQEKVSVSDYRPVESVYTQEFFVGDYNDTKKITHNIIIFAGSGWSVWTCNTTGAIIEAWKGPQA